MSAAACTSFVRTFLGIGEELMNVSGRELACAACAVAVLDSGSG